jgi:transglutaminase-like putative cysteine protease
MIVRLLRRMVSAETMGLLLVFIALQALTSGISSSLRNTDSRYFFWICLLSALIAFGLGRRNMNGIQASAGMTALGGAGIWILGARLLPPLLDLGSAVLATLYQVRPAIRSQLPVDNTAIKEAWRVVAEASTALSLRIQPWLVSLNGNVTVNDGLVRTMIWILIMWLVAAWMGWFAARRNAIAAFLPSIMLLAAITSYSEYRIETLWLMVFVLLLLMGLWNYRNHTAYWERRRVDYSESIRYDVTQAVLFLSVVIGLAAFITPSVSWRAIRDHLRERNRNEIAETLGVQQQPIPVKRAPAQKPVLPRDHLLSGGYAQSQQIVMTIRTGELPPVEIPGLTADAPRYYWRSTTYDAYVGAGWVTTSAPSQTYEANTPLIPGLLNGYGTLHLDVEMVQPEKKLHWSGILFSADVPITANWRLRPQSSLFADQSALLEADLFAALRRSEVRGYQAQSYVPLVSVEELRAASTDYPESIRDRYLWLPASVPERVYQLAGNITRSKPTPYDKAKAIEAYLRHYPYDLEVPAPPPDQDVADYFLFDLKKGYCDYYATAMVVLARASGLPARFVSGYAPGDYDAANAQYIVRELHAHSWAEVYFPGIGWIEFEPTASQPEIERAAEEGITNAQPDPTAAQLLNRFRLETLLSWLSSFLVIPLGVVLYFTWMERWLYLRLAPATAVEKTYRRLYRLGRRLAGERTQAETAFEFMQKVIEKIDHIKARSRFTDYLLRAQQDVRLLTGLYQDTLFAQHRINRDDARTAFNTWRHLRLRLLVATIIDRLQNLSLKSHHLFQRARFFPALTSSRPPPSRGE